MPTPDLETVLLAGNMANGVDIDMTATTSLINTDDGMVRIGSNFDSGQLLSNSPIEPVGVGGAGLSIYSGSTDTAGRFLFVASAGSTTGTGQIVFANPYPIGTTVIPVLTPSSGTSVQRIDNIGVDSADRFSFTYRWAKISPAGVSYLINVNYIVVAITGLPY